MCVTVNIISFKDNKYWMTCSELRTDWIRVEHRTVLELTSKLWLKSINSSRNHVVKIEIWRFAASNRLVESIVVDLDESGNRLTGKYM